MMMLTVVVPAGEDGTAILPTLGRGFLRSSLNGGLSDLRSSLRSVLDHVAVVWCFGFIDGMCVEVRGWVTIDSFVLPMCLKLL
jgi:hypothetical protein